MIDHHLPTGTLRHYAPADLGAAWALDLASLGSEATDVAGPPVPRLVSRALFHVDAAPDELAAALIEGCTAALAAGYDLMDMLHSELERRSAALSHMSRNSRMREAWLLVAALRATTRSQLARDLGLSRADADSQARALADATLADLGSAGRVDWQQLRPATHEPTRIDDSPHSEAAAELDATLAVIDRPLARTAS